MNNKSIKKMIFLSVVFLSLLSLLSDYAGTMVVQKTPTDATLLMQDEPQARWAFSVINITFDETSIEYKRQTHVQNIETPLGFELLRFSAIAHFTTHEDILLDMHLEFNTTLWNNNFTLFNNSMTVQVYEQERLAIQHITYVDISLLDIGPELFHVGNDTRIDPDNPTVPVPTFFILHQVVIRESTAFILSMNEPFRFDLNNIQLGQLEDFQLQVFFDNTEGVYDEELRIDAVGSPLEAVTSTQGLSGTIKLGEDFQPQEVPRFNRAFGSVHQWLTMSFVVAQEQHLTHEYSYGQFAEVPEIFTIDELTTQNSLTLRFETGDLMPIGVKLTTEIPFLERITPTEYLGFAGSALIASASVFKGVPFFMRRRRVGKYRDKLYKAASADNWTTFNDTLEEARDAQFKRKITAGQYRDFLFESNILKQQHTQTQPPPIPDQPTSDLDA